ncbi:HlyD family secretion protein [Bradyrhizobium liaoningense]|uniref:HlyD family secretion protein n=1 Tax=Bradyrhizobium liaoningense TaxID=43992 RepID=UPI001BAD4141|nr:HlyD family secretion protein [Bradyrhizobium liaoningense]MBR0907186.1 HlyD family secretion protein [Bradyrhizobium liaoningense]
MELLLLLVYIALCIAIFKVFRIPVNQWSLATAALGGGVGIALLLLVMNYNHPFTANARIYFVTTPILPGVKGRVEDVPVVANTPLKEGEVLFRIDPRPYQYLVDQKKAQVAEAEQNLKQLKATIDQQVAEVERVKAQLDLAQQTYDRQTQLFRTNDVSQATVDTASRNLKAAQETLAGARAAEQKARLAFTSEIDGVNTTVARLRSDLDGAEFDLDQTVVRAPTAGFVTQLLLRPGMYVIPTPLRPAMVFVHLGDKENGLIAAFQQNSLQRVHVGDDAEIAFPAVPGRVFKGRVSKVLDAIPAGQFQASGTLQDLKTQSADDRALAQIQIMESISEYQIPLGAAAEVAILTKHWEPVALLRRVLLRIKSWENFLFLESH